MNDAAELERDAAGWFAKNGEMCHANSITAVLCTAQCTHMYICYQVHLWAFYEHANKWIQFPLHENHFIRQLRYSFLCFGTLNNSSLQTYLNTCTKYLNLFVNKNIAIAKTILMFILLFVLKV